MKKTALFKTVLLMLCAVSVLSTTVLFDAWKNNVLEKYKIIKDYTLHIKKDYSIVIYDQTGKAIIYTNQANITEVEDE